MLKLGFKFKINVRVDLQGRLRLMLGLKLKDNVKGWG